MRKRLLSIWRSLCLPVYCYLGYCSHARHGTEVLIERVVDTVEEQPQVYLEFYAGPHLTGEEEGPIHILISQGTYEGICEKDPECWAGLILTVDAICDTYN